MSDTKTCGGDTCDGDEFRIHFDGSGNVFDVECTSCGYCQPLRGF